MSMLSVFSVFFLVADKLITTSFRCDLWKIHSTLLGGGFSSPTTQRASSTQFAVTRSRSGFINLVSDGLPSYSTGCAMFKCLHTICEELIWLLWEDRPG